MDAHAINQRAIAIKDETLDPIRDRCRGVVWKYCHPVLPHEVVKSALATDRLNQLRGRATRSNSSSAARVHLVPSSFAATVGKRLPSSIRGIKPTSCSIG